MWVNNLATLLEKQGKLAEAGPRSLGYQVEVSTGRQFSSAQDKGLVSFYISQSHWRNLGISVYEKLFVHVGLVLA